MRTAYKTTQLQGITDLTLIACVKSGFVADAFETETHVERLRRVLGLLGTIRQASRESELQPSPFADSIGRFQGIHFFRFAVVEPETLGPLPHLAPHRLFLNVTFDGGWEPYMRIIWKPLGTLLDLIFCHCDGYPPAFKSSYADYIEWVRAHELPSQFFYADSGATVGDSQYLARLEALQREVGERADSDLHATGLALPARSPEVIPTPHAIQASLRALKALASMRKLFPPAASGVPAQGDDGFLLRFAHDVLADLRAWVADGLFQPGQRYDLLGAGFKDELAWLMLKRFAPPPKADWLKFRPEDVQAGIAQAFRPAATVVHGALVLLRVVDESQALTWLRAARFSNGLNGATDAVVRTVALTYRGLVRLGVSQGQLDKMPREFIEGMEPRAGILGDVRGNHPLQWRRPRCNWQGSHQVPPIGPPIELSSVHVLVQLRTETQAGEEEPAVDAVYCPLRLDVAQLEVNSGLMVMAVQAMKQQPAAAGERMGRNHFGFADGLSQPSLSPAVPARVYWDDSVKTGELFLGYVNERGDGPDPVPPDSKPPSDLLLDNGTFLVVRKLRQHADRLAGVVSRAAQLAASDSPQQQQALQQAFRAKMMGRHSDGTPLVKIRGSGDNDFNYRDDPTGAACPFDAHIRRANPREPRPNVMPPRIVRRGMSYGALPSPADPGAEHGLIFMAYNASIAEQFEVIQRWLAGGNSSGVSSAQSDPFLGVPEAGKPRTYRFSHDGKVQRLDLGDQPLVQLEWGVYAFVPSIAALKAFPCPQTARGGPPNEPAQAETGAKEEWRRQLEDGKARGPAWDAVRAAGGVLNTDYGVLVGSAQHVREVLQDNGERFSVCGYGTRMKASIGLGYLGEDDVDAQSGHRLYAPMVNEVIAGVSEQDAFDAAFKAANAVLDRMLGQYQLLTGRRAGAVDLQTFSGGVIAALCTLWFGLPDGVHMILGGLTEDPKQDTPARCPGHFLAVARHVFSPLENPVVKGLAEPQGKALLAAVEQFLATSQRPKALLTDGILNALNTGDADLAARTLAGVMLGFPATVIGNLVSVLMALIESRALWDWQQQLAMQQLIGAPPTYAAVVPLLRGELLATMAQAPVPYMDWRTAVKDCTLGGVAIKAKTTVVVGLASAMKDVADPASLLMFGGSRGAGIDHGVHACPGYRMAVGVMLGAITALLTSRVLQPTPSPVILNVSA